MQAPLILGCVLALAACNPNQTGALAASKLGDTSHPLAPASPIDELRAACGDGALTLAGANVIHRRPYLQQVTTSSARIGWVTMAPAGEHVELTTADGAAEATATAVVQDGTPRTAGEKQVWTTFGNLESGSLHCYTVAGVDPLVGATGFRTAPEASSTAPIRFLAFGDSGGGGPDQRALREQMARFPYDLIIHTGDLAYDNGTIGQLEDNVFGIYADLFQNVAFFPSAGNHDYETMQGAPFREVFALPGNGPELWYSYDWGRIHFAALDTEADLATQAAWLDRDLAASAAPWKIVYLHRPPYSSGLHGSDLQIRAVLGPVVERHGVQLVLAGHDHDYERMKPQHGVAYVVTGGGGRGTYGVGLSEFSAFSDAVIHFVIVEVGVDELVLHAIDGTGTEFDSLVVPRAGA